MQVVNNTQFSDEKVANRFSESLKSTLSKLLKKGPISQIFIDSIEVSEESDQSLSYEMWDRMKGIREK